MDLDRSVFCLEEWAGFTMQLLAEIYAQRKKKG